MPKMSCNVIGMIEGWVGLRGGVGHGKFKHDNLWQIPHKPVSKYSIHIPYLIFSEMQPTKLLKTDEIFLNSNFKSLPCECHLSSQGPPISKAGLYHFYKP